MKNIVRKLASRAAPFLMAGLLAACAPAPPQSTGEYIDDAWITSRVEGAFGKDAELSAAQIEVNTYKGQVQLSGFVSRADEVGKAAAVAGGVKGVRSVRNDIQVR